MEELRYKEIWKYIKKHRIMIFTLAIGFAVVTGLVSQYAIAPKYRTSTSLIVGRRIPLATTEILDYNEVLVNQRMVGTYSQILRSEAILREVNEKLSLGMSAKDLAGMIDVQIIADTEIMTLTVTDKDQDRAVLIANEIASTFMEKIKNIMQVDNIQLLDEAIVPEEAIVPNTALNMAVAGLLGLTIGVALALITEMTDTRIKATDDFRKSFGIPLIGNIPKHMPKAMAKKRQSEGKPGIIGEAYHNLRTNVQFQTIDVDLKMIVITSTNPGEGKTTVSYELAKSLATGGDKVILIDCDFRNPTLPKLSGSDQTRGLSDILVNQSPYEPFIVKQEGLDLLMTGPMPPIPADLLVSKKMEAFLDKLRFAYHYVILDTPPAGLLTDGVILSTNADGTIIVVAEGQTERKDLNRTIESIRSVGGNVIGIVINKVESVTPPAYGKYY